MIRTASARRFLLSMIVMALLGASATALAANDHNGDDTPASPSSDLAGTSAARLQKLMDEHQLTELRTTYNGTYGASLLFQADKLTYYVALFHNKAFWRVIQTDSSEQAEGVYHSFAKQTENLAQVDIDAIRLKAGKDYAQHLIALNQQRLQNLQRSSHYQQQQAREVAQQQQQSKQQAQTLTTDLQSAGSQLDSVKQRIQALEAEQANPLITLPAPENATPPAATPDPAPASTDDGNSP